MLSKSIDFIIDTDETKAKIVDELENCGVSYVGFLKGIDNSYRAFMLFETLEGLEGFDQKFASTNAFTLTSDYQYEQQLLKSVSEWNLENTKSLFSLGRKNLNIFNPSSWEEIITYLNNKWITVESAIYIPPAEPDSDKQPKQWDKFLEINEFRDSKHVYSDIRWAGWNWLLEHGESAPDYAGFGAGYLYGPKTNTFVKVGQAHPRNVINCLAKRRADLFVFIPDSLTHTIYLFKPSEDLYNNIIDEVADEKSSYQPSLDVVNEMMKEKDFLTVQEASEILNINRNPLSVWIRKGRVEAKKNGKEWFVPVDEIRRLLEEKVNYRKAKDAADELGISYVSLLSWIRNGLLQATKQGKEWLIPIDEINRLLNEKSNYHTPKEVAEKLGISYFSVLSGIRNRQIAAIKQGKDWLVSQQEVSRLLEQKANYRTAKEAAKELGVSTRTIISSIKKGFLQATNNGKEWLIPTNEVRRFHEAKASCCTPKEAAEELGVSYVTVLSWIKASKINAVNGSETGGTKRLLIPVEEIKRIKTDGTNRQVKQETKKEEAPEKTPEVKQEYLTMRKAAQMLGISVYTIRRKIEEKSIPFRPADDKRSKYLISLDTVNNLKKIIEKENEQQQQKSDVESSIQTLPKGYISSSEAAQLLGISKPTLFRWKEKHQLSTIQQGKALYYSRSEIKKLAKNKKR